jgi:hypothetical protein
MERVTGIGGYFMRAADPAALGKGGLLRLAGLRTAVVYDREVNIRKCWVLGLAHCVVN